MNEQNISLILIEDDVLVAHNLKKNLENLGFNILNLCHSYEEGLEAIQEQDFDLLLTDINLGHERFSGIDLAIFAKKTKNIPTIFLTAYSDINTVKEATQVFPAGYLVKPISIASLYATIHNAFDNHITNRKLNSIENEIVSNLFFYTKVGNKLKKIFWSDVYLITVVKNYVVLKTVDKHSSLIRSSLINFTKKIIPQEVLIDFVQVSRNEMVDKKRITKIEEHQLIIENEIHPITTKISFNN